MNVVDSSGWLEYLADGSQASAFASAIEDTDQLLVPTVSLYEVFKRVRTLRGEELALRSVAQMQRGQIVELTSALALHAAELSFEHKLPMADSIIYATARLNQATLWTQDADFEGLPSVLYFPKPVSS
jgi:predicted nucleic acid-binding protein